MLYWEVLGQINRIICLTYAVAWKEQALWSWKYVADFATINSEICPFLFNKYSIEMPVLFIVPIFYIIP